MSMINKHWMFRLTEKITLALTAHYCKDVSRIYWLFVVVLNLSCQLNFNFFLFFLNFIFQKVRTKWAEFGKRCTEVDIKTMHGLEYRGHAYTIDYDSLKLVN